MYIQHRDGRTELFQGMTGAWVMSVQQTCPAATCLPQKLMKEGWFVLAITAGRSNFDVRCQLNSLGR
ncbi:hypothetical protein Tph_c01150 [Thermacetogenium phaeum DSM 12270]|uniref:Uncharacterized protein n=1 Tax=Thermacetogenium phaeum (strain ATCC BAA-254 / DSM 26808 / PB) TaxID=1089553 RepID=K4LCA7_THEPS|nr:hypothetical protein Tph_c01150 [Thermacetogenium phaeum DSM 12270]